MSTIIIDAERCNGCGVCARVCSGPIEQAKKKSVPLILEPEACIACGHCVAVCPVDAIWLGHVDMQNFPSVDRLIRLQPEGLLQFLRGRRSVRVYSKRSVSKRTVEQLLEAGRYAPTACNTQALDYVVVQQPETLEAIARLCIEEHRADILKLQDEVYLASLDPAEAGNARRDAEDSLEAIRRFDRDKGSLFFNAPGLIVVHASPKGPTTPAEDATLASFSIMLMAESLGLGTCYIGDFYLKANQNPTIKMRLAIPPENDILIAFSFGYPAVRYRRLPDRRKPEVAWK